MFSTPKSSKSGVSFVLAAHFSVCQALSLSAQQPHVSSDYHTGSVQFSSVAQSCSTLCDPLNCSTPGSLSITKSRSSLKLMSVKLVMPSSHLILCRPLLLLPLIFLSIRVFSNESVLQNRWPKYWSFSLRFSPPNEYSGLISFRMDWLDLLASKGLSRVFSNTTV